MAGQKQKKQKPYSTEQELCDTFVEVIKPLGWRVFPETSGFDLLLIATPQCVGKRPDIKSGDQIGVQAKLRPNLDVLVQAMPDLYTSQGPHYHAVLVPEATSAFTAVARRLSLVVFHAFPDTRKAFEYQIDAMPITLRHYYSRPAWHPDHEILVAAGVPSPRSVTPWKVKAVRLCVLGLKRGFLTRIDFLDSNIGMGMWVQNHWIRRVEGKTGKLLHYAVDEVKAPHAQYPEITEVIRAEDPSYGLGTAKAEHDAPAREPGSGQGPEQEAEDGVGDPGLRSGDAKEVAS